MLDLDFVRAQFPAFSEPSLADTAFFENAGGSYMCGQVIAHLERYFRQTKVQPYYPYPASETAGKNMDAAYPALAAWMNVTPEEVYLGPSTSQNIYVLAQAMLGWLKSGDEIIVTNQDHEANGGAWRRLAEHGILVKEWQVDPETGSLDLARFTELLTERTKLVTFPHCSNILAEMNPVAEICRLAKANGTRTVVDGVSFAGHGLPDVTALGADIYLYSLYKVYGPHLGVMVIRDDMVGSLTNQSHFFNGAARTKRLMPAGPDHAQVAAVQGVADYFEALYRHHFSGHADEVPQKKAELVRGLLSDAEKDVTQPLLSYFEAHPAIRLVGPADAARRAPTVSVVIDTHTHMDLVAALGEQGVMCGSGHFYSLRLIEALGLDPEEGVLRVSLVHYTSTKDVQKLINSLDKLL